jgi:fermentation-respiration switch protein FrsA (DUF1100 family)
MEVAGSVALGGAVLLLILSLLQERIAFQPSPWIETTPASLGLSYEDCRLTASDGKTITGWWIPAPSPPLADSAGSVPEPPAILFLHGNAGNISHRILHVSHFHRAGFSVLIIDYRGYGESAGSPTERGLQRDARAAWEHLVGQRGVPPGRVILYGESIGSAPALHLTQELAARGEEGPGAVIIEGAFTSAGEMAGRVFPFLPVRWVLRLRMDNLSAVKRIRTPLLSIHGSRDEIVPFRMGRAVHEASISQTKEFFEVDGAMHNTVWLVAGDEVRERIRAFAERVLVR